MGGAIPPFVYMEEELTDDQRRGAMRVVVATPTEMLPQLLIDNSEKSNEIKEMIAQEITLRKEGVKRIPAIEEAAAMFQQ